MDPLSAAKMKATTTVTLLIIFLTAVGCSAAEANDNELQIFIAQDDGTEVLVQGAMSPGGVDGHFGLSSVSRLSLLVPNPTNPNPNQYEHDGMIELYTYKRKHDANDANANATMAMAKQQQQPKQMDVGKPKQQQQHAKQMDVGKPKQHDDEHEHAKQQQQQHDEHDEHAKQLERRMELERMERMELGMERSSPPTNTIDIDHHPHPHLRPYFDLTPDYSDLTPDYSDSDLTPDSADYFGGAAARARSSWIVGGIFSLTVLLAAALALISWNLKKKTEASYNRASISKQMK